MNNVRTVSDTKRAFYNTHTRPVNSIYRRVVEELMVEMHLLTVNIDFRYDPIYALGVVTSFDRFMQGYRPEEDKASIFNAICQSLGDHTPNYRGDAEHLLLLASQHSWDELLSLPGQSSEIPEAHDLRQHLQAIVNNPKFKYSRLFAIGLFTILQTADPTLIKDEVKRTEALKQVCSRLNLPQEKLQKDLELYSSNLEKMIQAQIVMEDLIKADRKKREERAQAKAAANDAAVSEPPKDEATSSS
ncbi:photosystem II biogenesis protein Psp29 [Phormidesmis priestleyi ULC007]|uniref:Protein Thf1 n=1 Tax=Phormidesmis priestleyi ULC007 TaxID=1920490 RepID=A0A2T1DBJ7_9CYAN|nr:photosystem II biogenesis protein Psp29 [Phormidesmis priestleyi]PSB17824.1 photosystem II biogenesis protein Psp29 [Phormidesmis priestleyi ULC007]PZO46472.1 MAG: photosystem II biogenesis protein Psp29 [Phormidesmis priestleyi]